MIRFFAAANRAFVQLTGSNADIHAAVTLHDLARGEVCPKMNIACSDVCHRGTRVTVSV